MWVHPRSRGEYDKSYNWTLAHWGSPPLTRGILWTYTALHCLPGFTPAHAGNTIGSLLVNIYLLGSPPLTRGIPILFFGIYRMYRFTPAHAGNTKSLHQKSIIPKVHPRSRGEYLSCCLDMLHEIGSPPLTRGILLLFILFIASPRFTPAHAGNTSDKCIIKHILKVHPRSRGEYYFGASTIRSAPGSPPLTRGIPSA